MNIPFLDRKPEDSDISQSEHDKCNYMTSGWLFNCFNFPEVNMSAESRYSLLLFLNGA